MSKRKRQDPDPAEFIAQIGPPKPRPIGNGNQNMCHRGIIPAESLTEEEQAQREAERQQRRKQWRIDELRSKDPDYHPEVPRDSGQWDYGWYMGAPGLGKRA